MESQAVFFMTKDFLLNSVPDDSGEDSGESVAVPELAVEADGGEGAPDALTRDVV